MVKLMKGDYCIECGLLITGKKKGSQYCKPCYKDKKREYMREYINSRRMAEEILNQKI
ncbi:MAG: hypothetical protein R3321_13405 [Nitrososphaeraceae archaeon]|nr:hypothetical protein [Nitrososphaeraceae archaeon]